MGERRISSPIGVLWWGHTHIVLSLAQHTKCSVVWAFSLGALLWHTRVLTRHMSSEAQEPRLDTTSPASSQELTNLQSTGRPGILFWMPPAQIQCLAGTHRPHQMNIPSRCTWKSSSTVPGPHDARLAFLPHLLCFTLPVWHVNMAVHSTFPRLHNGSGSRLNRSQERPN